MYSWCDAQCLGWILPGRCVKKIESKAVEFARAANAKNELTVKTEKAK